MTVIRVRAPGRAPTGLTPDRAEHDPSLAEVIATQVPRLPRDATEVVIALGARDILDGFDESYIHARVVELLDAVRRATPAAAIVVIGFPPLGAELDATRRQCDGAARASADLRGAVWRQRAGPAP